jgi:hypothetical protein
MVLENETVKKSVLVDGEIKLHPKRFENRTLVKLTGIFVNMVHDGTVRFCGG